MVLYILTNAPELPRVPPHPSSRLCLSCHFHALLSCLQSIPPPPCPSLPSPHLMYTPCSDSASSTSHSMVVIRRGRWARSWRWWPWGWGWDWWRRPRWLRRRLAARTMAPARAFRWAVQVVLALIVGAGDVGFECLRRRRGTVSLAGRSTMGRGLRLEIGDGRTRFAYQYASSSWGFGAGARG